MTDSTVQELDTCIQQLSLGDQLWLMEKLAQHIRIKFNDVAGRDEELTEQESGIFDLNPDSPLYEDMQQILEDKKQDRLKFYSQLTTDGNNRWRAWSPDGQYLLYTHDTGEEEYELYILEVGRGTPKLLSKAACCATWRGNSDEIIFLSLVDEQLAIETIKPDGSAHKLIFSPLTLGRSDWPTGNMAWLQVDVEAVLISLEGVFSFPDTGLTEYKTLYFLTLQIT